MKRLELDTNNLVELYLAGTSEKALAESFGVSRGAVRRRLLKRGVAIRNRSEAMFNRMARATKQERMRLTMAAHQAARGPRSHSTLCNRARGVERSGKQSKLEIRLQKLLARRGVTCIPQKAIGPYNCDLASAPVAVEVFGGGWHFYGVHLEGTPKRLRYLLDAGWHVLMIAVDARRFPLTAEVADYAAAWVKQRRREPAMIREYRVVRGAGELLAAGCADDGEISIIPTFRSGRDSLGRYQSIPG